MMIIRKITSRRKYNKELINIAKLSGSICFIDRQLTERLKHWDDVKDELFNIQNILNTKLGFYNSMRNNVFNLTLIEFTKAEIVHCDNVIANHMIS